MRRLYADMSPGLGWNGRDPEALEVATATQASTRTATLDADGLALLADNPRPLAFLVGGTTPAHAPATATITGTDDDTGDAATEVVYLPTNSAGARTSGAVCSQTAWSDVDSVVYSAGSGTGATVAIGLGLIPGVADLRLIPIETWLEAFPDRSRPGLLSVIAINELVRDGSAWVDSQLTGSFDLPLDLPPPPEAAKAARNYIIATAAEFRPTVFVVERETLLKNADALIQRIRAGQSGMGQTPPDPGLNVGGLIVSQGPRLLTDGTDGTVNGGDF